MSSISTLHTLAPGANIPFGYFDEDNIRFIQNKIKEVLKREFVQDILVDRASIIRVMERVLLEWNEVIPKLNQRVVMYITNEFRNHQGQRNKHARWESYFVESQRLYDPTVESQKFDGQFIKLANCRGFPKVGGKTSRFYFT